jgi:hypothetical protein
VETLWTREDQEGDGKLALIQILGKLLLRMGGGWNLLRIISLLAFGISAGESFGSAIKELAFEGLLCVWQILSYDLINLPCFISLLSKVV